LAPDVKQESNGILFVRGFFIVIDVLAGISALSWNPDVVSGSVMELKNWNRKIS
jgi:hypothetical protein